MPKGYTKVVAAPPVLRLVMRVGGREKNGKTHFALTAPGDIGIIDMDRGLEGVVEKFISGKDIYTIDFRDMPNSTQDHHNRRWEKFETEYATMLADSTIRSILWDTDTEAWEMARLAYFGKLTQTKSHHYVEINAMFRKLVDDALASDTNLVMIGRYKKQYVKKNPTSDDSVWNGKFEPAGFTELPSIAQVNLKAQLIKVEGYDDVPSVTVVDCRQNMTLNGEVYEGDEACFPWVAAMIVGGTTPEDWE